MYADAENPGAWVLLTLSSSLKETNGSLSLGTWVLLIDLTFQIQAIFLSVLLPKQNIYDEQLESRPQISELRLS